MITTKVKGVIDWLTGDFYHQVNIYRNKEIIDSKKVMCCEDDEEASYYAVSLSHKLTQQEKENYCF